MSKDYKGPKLKKIIITVLVFLGLLFAVLGSMIAFSSPTSPPTLESVAAPFRNVDFSKLPPLIYYTARDGANLSYRAYTTPGATRTVVLIHGSSGSCISMHPLGSFLRNNGLNAYALDIRGHGDSGTKGYIDYIGQLEDDLEDFVNKELEGNTSAVLTGFSSGGGFVLRFAGSDRQKLFSQYVLLSPYIGVDSPTARPDNGGWTDISVPRYEAIAFLGPIGEKLFGNLPVVAFAIDMKNIQFHTVKYSFRLSRNFCPHDDYESDIINAKQPMTVLVGDKDEIFISKEFKPLFAELRPQTKVIIVPGATHVTLTIGQPGMNAVLKAVSP